MSNVYTLVEHFYNSNSDFDRIMPREKVEKYLRRKAWHGTKDKDLKNIWSILSLLIAYTEQLNLYSLASLSVYDYQEIMYRYAQEHEDFCLTEESVLGVVNEIEDFFAYLQEDAPEVLATLKDLRESFFEGGRFVMPSRRSPDEFYSSLEHMEDISEKEMNQLNMLMDSLLHRMDAFFRQQDYKNDMDRALNMFIGPENVFLLEELSHEEARSFWLCFWDFFLFDYHMSVSDESPLRLFYKLHKDKLSLSERDILLDLMRSDFLVLSLEYYDIDRAVCRNLFNDEILELPLQSVYDGDAGESIIYGHTCTKGAMMLNYITVLPASQKLQKRMKEEILKLYDIFKCQFPDASFSDFCRRHAGAVRHTLNILGQFAQLNVGARRPAPSLKSWDSEGAEAYGIDMERLTQTAMNFGLSRFSAGLACRLFCDYMHKAGMTGNEADLPAAMIAAIMKFLEVNGLDTAAVFEIMKDLGEPQEEIIHFMDDIQKKLAVSLFDPRYLSEEGLIHSLYFEQAES